jgi:RimJ/RimL family protein N-acetyltransferase
MSALPKTVLEASPSEEAAIRCAVRDPSVAGLGPDCEVAASDHVEGLVKFLSDPAVSGPIYDLPRPISIATIMAWVEESARLQARGEALLIIRKDEDGETVAYSRFTVWPQRSSAELAGASRSDRQGKGQGKAGAARNFDWMFETLGVRLVCLTAALDNVRSAKVIEAAGFQRMGERDAVRPDGSVRRSLYWEMTREQWLARRPRVPVTEFP